MSCAAQVFSNVSKAQMDGIRAKVAQEMGGTSFDGTHATISHSGITLDCTYDPIALTLTILCTGKPFIISCGHVNQVVHDLVEGCLA